jgi:hypothetical protein
MKRAVNFKPAETALAAMIGSSIRIETWEGTFRTGKLTGLRSKDLTIDGAVYQKASDLVMNGDDSDPVPWDAVRSITVQ